MFKYCAFLIGLFCISFVTPAQVNYCENYGTTTPWNATAWNFYNMRQTKKTGLTIDQGNFFHGLLEYLPSSYASNPSKKYPVIIYFHGYGSRGSGSLLDLCRLFKDRGSDLATHLSIPGRIEKTPELFTVAYGGQSYEYIVISPQFDKYQRLGNPTPNVPDDFPSFDAVDDVIDYVQSHYRVDPRRIYLTGLSNGANIITEYAASSLERAQRVAAIMPVALCSQADHDNNTSRGINPAYIGQAKLKTWFVYCEVDNCGVTGQDNDVPVKWVNGIKAVTGHAPPRYTVLRNVNPPTLYNCSDTLTHDAWSRAYDPNFKASFTGDGTGVGGSVNDGINMNMYQWLINQQSAVLPVTLKSFSIRLINNKVQVNWVTTDEKDNSHFSIERAGEDQKFASIGTVPGAGNNTSEKEYSFTDNSPLTGLNYYRLVQTDIDGKKNYFEIKRVLNSSNKNSSVVVSPNPFGENLTAFISLDKSQKVLIAVSDMTGKILKTTNGIYGQGSTELKIQSNDLPKGIYLLRISGENFSSTQKVFKK